MMLGWTALLSALTALSTAAVLAAAVDPLQVAAGVHRPVPIVVQSRSRCFHGHCLR